MTHAIRLGSTAQTLVIALPGLLGLKAHDELRFLQFSRSPGAKRRVRARKSARQRVAEWLRHSEFRPEDFLTIPTEQFSRNRLNAELEQARRAERMIAICSTCRQTDGVTRHIPLMDFRCRPTPARRQLLTEALRGFNLPGLVLESGGSYHLYGLRLLGEDDWRHFVARCLLLGDLADWRYVGHVLLRQMCSLRIHGNSEPKIPEPRVVARVGV